MCLLLQGRFPSLLYLGLFHGEDLPKESRPSNPSLYAGIGQPIVALPLYEEDTTYYFECDPT